MNTSEEQDTAAMFMPLEIVWRNPLSFVRAQLKPIETSHPYCQWADQARKIWSRRSKWNRDHRWSA